MNIQKRIPVELDLSPLKSKHIPDLLKKAALVHNVYGGIKNFKKTEAIKKAFISQLKEILLARVNNEKITKALNVDLYIDSHKKPVSLLEQICKAIYRHYIQGKRDKATIAITEQHLARLNTSPAKIIEHAKGFQYRVKDIMDIRPYIDHRNIVIEFAIKT